jgi:hypothetical protein
MQTAAVNVPRIGHHVWNGSAWVNEGLLHESEARTNLLLNSDTLSTQSVTVTAAAHTLHFTGTGTITLSGASTAGPLVGTGAGESNRVTLTFTPTDGTLTLTVSGTVSNAQLEAAPTPSSSIPTAGSAVTRAADVLTVPAVNLPYNSTALSIQMDGRVTYADQNLTNNGEFWSWGSTEYLHLRIQSNTTPDRYLAVNNTTAGGFTGHAFGLDGDLVAGVLQPVNSAVRFTSTQSKGASNGVADGFGGTATGLTDLSATNLTLGANYMGTIRTFRMWGQDITDAGLEAATT